MKKVFIPFLLAISLITQSFIYSPRYFALIPIFDSPQADTLPKKWRSAKQDTTDLVAQNKFSVVGLDRLAISGSGQFTEENFTNMVRQLAVARLIVFDLREESHGLINGDAVSWTDGQTNYANVGKTLAEIEADENLRLVGAVQKGSIVVLNPAKDAQRLVVKQAKTEREFVESMGYTYVRLPITDHNRPSNEAIDQFVRLVKDRPSDSWVHVHCKGGKGRTTTFMALYDMMFNAQDVELADIIERQKWIGGADLVQTDKPLSFKQKPAEERLELVRTFYTYCREVPNFEISWSEWVSQQHALASNP